MARKPRIEFPHAFYHVIARGNRKQKVFWNDEDYNDYLSKLESYRGKFGFIMHAYCLMPNHVHLLIETGDIPISRIMHGLQSSYTQAFNKRHEKVGHLFQGRYKAIICDRDSYLLELIRYIHLNPTRAGLASRPEEYNYSSHKEYLGLVKTFCIDENSILLFGKGRANAVKIYSNFLRDGMKNGHRSEFYKLKDQRILGDDEFAEELLKKSDGWTGEHWNISMQEIIEATCKAFETDPLFLAVISRRRKEALVRGIVGFLAKKLCGATLGKIGAIFNRDEPTMSYQLRSVENKMQTDALFMEKVAELEKALIRNKRPLLVRIKETKKRNT